MNPLALPLALASILRVPADLVGRAELGDRTELRLRWTAPPEYPALDAENIPSIRAELATVREHVAVGYAPRLTIRDVVASGFPEGEGGNVSPSYELFHDGSLEAGWHDRHTTLVLRERGTYGQNNFSSLTLTTNPDGSLRIEPVPTQGAVLQCSTFRFASSDTQAMATIIPARRWRWTTTANFTASGGLDDCSQRILAPLKAVEASTNFDHTLDRRTHFLFGVVAGDTAFSVIETTETGTITGDADYALLNGWLGFGYAFLPHTEGRLTFGGAVLRARVSGRPEEVTPYPTSEASLTHKFGELDDRYELTASVRLEPLVNRLAAVVDQRLEERLVASRTRGLWALAVAGGATQSIPNDRPSGVALFTADVTVLYHATHHLDFDIGARYLWQHTRASSPDALVQLTESAYDSKLLYVAVVLHDDTLRFLGGSPPSRAAAAAGTAPGAVTTPPVSAPPRPPRTETPEGPPDFNADPHPPPPLP